MKSNPLLRRFIRHDGVIPPTGGDLPKERALSVGTAPRFLPYPVASGGKMK